MNYLLPFAAGVSSVVAVITLSRFFESLTTRRRQDRTQLEACQDEVRRLNAYRVNTQSWAAGIELQLKKLEDTANRRDAQSLEWSKRIEGSLLRVDQLDHRLEHWAAEFGGSRERVGKTLAVHSEQIEAIAKARLEHEAQIKAASDCALRLAQRIGAIEARLNHDTQSPTEVRTAPAHPWDHAAIPTPPGADGVSVHCHKCGLQLAFHRETGSWHHVTPAPIGQRQDAEAGPMTTASRLTAMEEKGIKLDHRITAFMRDTDARLTRLESCFGAGATASPGPIGYTTPVCGHL